MSRKVYLIALLVTVVQLGCAKVESHFKEPYIVVLKKGAKQELSQLSSIHSVDSPEKTFSSAIRAGVYNLTSDQVVTLAEDPDVAYIEKDHIVSINNEVEAYSVIQNNVTWGLDRLDQVNLPLDRNYAYSAGSSVVNVYVVDTGILTTHNDFQGRAFHGIDVVDKDSDATDCNGHGTHVAGTIGSATYGVAKNVKLYGVRVLDCNGSGRFSDVIAGIEWVAANHVSPAVANLSLGGPVSQAVDDAIRSAIQSGVTFVVAAGNSNTDACRASPSRVAEAITVGSTTSSDSRSSFSNYGTCVDLFAPGSDIKSLWYNSNSATNTISGTSMASPHVAGVAALYLETHPSATPFQVSAALVAGATTGKVSNNGAGSPNKLLNTIFVIQENDGPIEEDPNPDEPNHDGSLVSGLPVSNLSGAKLEEVFFTIDVPEGSANLVVEISGGGGDADLYIRKGVAPTSILYDCRPFKSGNIETCTTLNPEAGKWHIMIRGYAAFSGVSVKATVTKKNEGSCPACATYSGVLNAKGEFLYLPSATGYSNSGGAQEFALEGPAGTDFDLYLYKLNGSTWVQVASSTSIKSLEQIKYVGDAGTYRIKVNSYAGSGSFTLTVK